MASKHDSNSEEPIADINITPFVDVILVILIIFMLAAPMVMNKGINVNLPRASTGEATEKASLNISVTMAGEIFLNGKMIKEALLRDEVKDAVAKDPSAQAIIAADKDVPHGQVMSVLDQVKAAGVRKFAISIDQK